MTYATIVTVTCDVCQERTTEIESTFVNKSWARDRLRSRGWKLSKGQVPYKCADRQVRYRDGERVVCPTCFGKGLHR